MSGPGSIIMPPSSVAPTTFVDCVNITATGSALTGGGYAGYTIVCKYFPAILAAGGSLARITVFGPSSGTSSLNACWIGQVANSGNAYDFDGGQQQAFWTAAGGSSAITLGTGASAVSDNITFAVTQAKAILVAFSFAASPASNDVRRTGLGSNYASYLGAGLQEAATTVKTGGYAPEASINVAFRIEVA